MRSPCLAPALFVCLFVGHYLGRWGRWGRSLFDRSCPKKALDSGLQSRRHVDFVPDLSLDIWAPDEHIDCLEPGLIPV